MRKIKTRLKLFFFASVCSRCSMHFIMRVTDARVLLLFADCTLPRKIMRSKASRYISRFDPFFQLLFQRLH